MRARRGASVASRRARPGLAALPAVALTTAALAGCAAPADPVATFRVGDETFRVALASPELVEHAEALLAGEAVASIPNGVVVHGDPGPNAPWSWHIDPATLEFADMTIELCDGLPSFVERHEVSGDRYCPWDATLVAIER